ncbi:MgtC/SapB family protein [Oribacterium sp. WCC10]|uniref:MgtC/SapB family protein n=1 Tax=Oribacterium sp. WCC10 TaxID=1855343 RepID=UPI0008E93563|nr:MgtC/SapB family protein [Oribacterium sp. WCC10]SFG16099.1 putative Mg2+ transporter-C (MgtC) family protein [Oribacterium sp. WCC10]
MSPNDFINTWGTVRDPIAEILGPWSEGLTTGSILFRIMLSILFSSVIGWERSSKRHSAGLRTFILVSLASTLVIMVDQYISYFRNGGGFVLSAAAIIAVAIISINSMFYSSRNQIKGLTTSVGLWASCIVGLSLGIGFYTTTFISFLALLGTLSWFPVLETYLKDRSNHFEVHLELKNSVYLQDFVSTIRRLGLSIDEIELNPAYAGSGLSVYSIAISISSDELKKYKTHAEIIEALRSLDYIYHIEEMQR